MNSIATKRFWTCFDALPGHVRHQAERAYELWARDSTHPSLDFKRVGVRTQIYSVRIGLRWRALAIRDGETYAWMWIGSHAEYDQLLKRLR